MLIFSKLCRSGIIFSFISLVFVYETGQLLRAKDKIYENLDKSHRKPLEPAINSHANVAVYRNLEPQKEKRGNRKMT